MSSEVPVIETPPTEEKKDNKQATLNPKEADKIAEKEFKSKYPGFGGRPSGLAQRKISSTGGRQYFDSGEYNKTGSKKDRQRIASFPVATDPKSLHSPPTGLPAHLAHMKPKPKAPTSSLANPAQ